MSISLIKKQDNSKENSQNFQKLLFSKREYFVTITTFLCQNDYNDNIFKTGISYVYLCYNKDTNGILFLKSTLKKLLKLKNVIFKDFSRQEVIEILETPTDILLQE